MTPIATPGELQARLDGLEAELPELRLLVVFGSAAKGRARDDSDLDLAVLCDRVADLDRLYVALAPRCRTSRLDLIDLRRAAPLLAFEVARSGHVLFDRESSHFRQFQSLAWRRYVDTKKLRDAERRALEVFRSRTSA